MAETSPGEAALAPDLKKAFDRTILLDVPHSMAKVYDDISRHKEGSLFIPFAMTSDTSFESGMFGRLIHASNNALTELHPPVESSVVQPLTWEIPQSFIPGAGIAVAFPRDTNRNVPQVGTHRQTEPYDAFIVVIDDYGLRISTGEYLKHYNHNDGTFIDGRLHFKSPVAKPALERILPFKPNPEGPYVMPDPRKVTIAVCEVYNNWAVGRRLGKIKPFTTGPAPIINLAQRRGKTQ